MNPRRAAHLGVALAATYLVRILAHLKPQRWLHPAVSLRLFRLSSELTNELTTNDLRRHLPPSGWSTRTDLRYSAEPSGTFDLVVPEGPGPHPWVVWVHGGGWHFGDKSDVLPYVERLASRGFAGAVVNYPLAPRAKYPDALTAVGAATRHLIDHAEEYDLDADRLVLAGDSVGAQLVAQLATQFATRLATTSEVRPRGLLLFCGIFEPAALDDSDRMFEAVLESAMWSMTRTRRWQSSPACAAMSVVSAVTADYPPTFLSTGRQDPLYRGQTPPMASRLAELGVPLDEYYPGDEAEPCYHEFQLRLGTRAGAEAFERAVAFLGRVLA